MALVIDFPPHLSYVTHNSHTKTEKLSSSQ